jgi:adenylate cyclase
MNTQEVKRKLTAILSADVKGYSRLMGEDEEGTIRTLNTYKEVMSSLIQQQRGRVVDAPGDNVLAEFGSVVDAVRCAVDIQKGLKTRNAELPENRRMEFRIGVNLGDVVEDGGQILGDGVNIAARLESLSEAGGICISGTAFDQVKNKLNLGYKYLGEQTVKNILEPVRVYRVLMEPEAAGKVIGEKKVKPRQWQMATLGLVVILIVVVAAIVIWKFYIPSAPQPEVTTKEKIAVSQTEKAPTVAPPSTEVAPKEKLVPPSPEKVSKPMVQPAPKVEVASKEKMVFPLPGKPSIAVLPFANMSGNPEQEYFCDGLTEEVINALSNLPQVFVIARNSTFTYKGKAVDIKQVGREMGVQYVMEGSIRREGNRLRITAQLIDALTGRHVFSERYDRELKEIFAIQDEITIKVLTALRVALTDGEFARFQDRGVTNLEAYLKLLEAKELANRVHRESNAQARRLAEEALSLDPRSAKAYSILALTHFWDYWLGPPKSPDESIRLGIEMAQKAISMDENYADAHGLLGMLYINKGDYEKAVESGEQGASLAPNSAGLFVTYGSTLMHSSRPAEAIPILEKALRLSPVKPFSMSLANLGNSHRMIGKYEEAVPFYKRLLKDLPMHLPGNIGLTATYAQMGRMEDARAQAAELMKIDPRFSLERWARTLRYRDPADTERVLDALRKAGLK